MILPPQEFQNNNMIEMPVHDIHSMSQSSEFFIRKKAIPTKPQHKNGFYLIMHETVDIDIYIRSYMYVFYRQAVSQIANLYQSQMSLKTVSH